MQNCGIVTGDRKEVTPSVALGMELKKWEWGELAE